MTLKLNDIREWLIENRDEFQKLKAQEFPPFDNPLYSTYNFLYKFFEFFKFQFKCQLALQELALLKDTDVSEVIDWVKKYEILGSQDLLMFDVNYMSWNEQINIDEIKIHEGLYTDRKPFQNIICFCEVFQHLYWNNSIHNNQLTETEIGAIVLELRKILDRSYLKTN